MNTPEQVKKAAQYLIDMYGDHVEHLGEHQGAEAFYYHFPDDVDAGFPPVYLLKGGKLTELTGFEALRLIRLYVKD